jgi:hypothetical protein
MTAAGMSPLVVIFAAGAFAADPAEGRFRKDEEQVFRVTLETCQTPG